MFFKIQIYFHLIYNVGKLMTIKLHDSMVINDEAIEQYKVRCSPYSVEGNKGISRSRRVMGQINVVKASVGDDKEAMPVLVLALVTIKIGDEQFAPFFIVAPMIEIEQDFAYLPYPVYAFDQAPKGGWIYKVIQARQIIQPLCAIPVLKKNSTYDQNPHNESKTWYYIIGNDRFKYGASRKEEYYTQMTPKTKVFPTYDELLEIQDAMGLTPSFDTDMDYVGGGEDESDDESETGNVYDEDEKEVRFDTDINEEEKEIIGRRKKGGDEEGAQDEEYNSSDSEDYNWDNKVSFIKKNGKKQTYLYIF